MINKIEEIEELRKVVFKKLDKDLYKDFQIPMILYTYGGLGEERLRFERAVDEKTLFYIKLGITAEDLSKEESAEKKPENKDEIIGYLK